MIWEKSRRNGKILLNCTAGVAGLLLAGTSAWGQTNMLGNPGFENPALAPNTDEPMQNTPGGTPIASWYGWNNWNSPYSAFYDDNIPAHSGNQVGKTYGGMTYTGNGPNAGIFQPVPANPGDSYTAYGWFVNSSGNGDIDQLNNGETDDVRLLFDPAANGAGTTIATDITPTPLTEYAPTDVWTQLNVLAVAPAGTESVVWMAFFSNPTDAGGALYVDDAYLGYSPLIWNNSGGTGDGATWDVNTNQNWSDGTNEALFPNGAPVTFNDNNNGHYSVNIPSAVQPFSTTFNSTKSYTLSGAGGIGGTGSLTQLGTGTVTLATANTYSGGTFVTNGMLKIAPTSSTTSALPAGPVTITGGSLVLENGVTTGSQSANTPATAPTSNVNITSLAISGNGTLDLGNNHIIINYGSGADPLSSIASWIASGAYGSGTTVTWTGTGITSSAAKANSASYGIGYADSADAGNPAGLASGQIEIMYTLLGDANLDGKVNGSDFNLMATNFNQAVTAGWDKGDFNYDGKVNGNDFVLLAANFNQFASQSADSSADAAALDDFAAANGISLASVPEPASIGLLAVGALGLFTRRRRRE
jgi:autotransporter-associated beta strand protein